VLQFIGLVCGSDILMPLLSNAHNLCSALQDERPTAAIIMAMLFTF